MPARSRAPRPTRQDIDKTPLASLYEARQQEEANLDRLARRLRGAGRDVRLAGTYHGDGAYETANAILVSVHRELLDAVRVIEQETWRVAVNAGAQQ